MDTSSPNHALMPRMEQSQTPGALIATPLLYKGSVFKKRKQAKLKLALIKSVLTVLVNPSCQSSQNRLTGQ